MFLLIDNYDSFTYNLAQAFMSLGKKPTIFKNDDPGLLDLATAENLEMVCISPGPGHPDNAGLAPEFLRRLPPTVPVLGICLGHQILGRHAGAEIEIAPAIMHGKQSKITHDATGMYQNLPNPMTVGRYHSLAVKETPESRKLFKATAHSHEGVIMGLQYLDRPWVGAQFHPESILTPEGMEFLANFPDAILPEAEPVPIAKILQKISAGENMPKDMAAQAFARLMDGEFTPAQAGAFLTLLHMKGESASEIAEAIKAVLKRAVPVPGIEGDCIDIVGTGGDGKNSFNCSTATSLTLAGMGYKVAKHGNRAVSSTCGAADAIEALGITLDNDPDAIGKMLERRNFAFIFAPHFHPSFKHVGPTRRELGVPTLFNILGPMVNPARPSHLLMGVARPELVPLIADALARSGIHKAAVVCGAGNYDEISPLGPATMTVITDGKKENLTVDPRDYQIFPCHEDDLACKSKQEAVDTLKELLRGEGPAPMRDMVILNAGAAIYLLEPGISMPEAMNRAKEAVNAGAGAKVLENA